VNTRRFSHLLHQSTSAVHSERSVEARFAFASPPERLVALLSDEE